MNVLLHGCRAVVRRTGLTAALLLLALLVAAPLAAKPIPLTQPLDLRGKRVVVVAAMGHMAATSRTHMDILGTTVGFRQRFFPAPIDLDTIVAREAAAALIDLGVEAEVVALDYRDDDLYDVDVLVRTRKTSSFRPARRNAWARDLLRQHGADALLFIQSGERYVGRYAPPARNYGLYFPPPQLPANSYVHMIQTLYGSDREESLVQRGATAAAPLGDLQIAAAVEGDEPEPRLTDAQWVAARPSLELAAAHGARALAKDILRACTEPARSRY
ncbi:hypothetical protein ACFJIW_20070 [Tahibacter sp. UC22_41]|uniref:hypothetical protein n=1 Tax=Tahibacter sp. UC22_41 TaxID=3350178 RepID=UPI0036D9FA62